MQVLLGFAHDAESDKHGYWCIQLGKACERNRFGISRVHRLGLQQTEPEKRPSSLWLCRMICDKRSQTVLLELLHSDIVCDPERRDLRRLRLARAHGPRAFYLDITARVVSPPPTARQQQQQQNHTVASLFFCEPRADLFIFVVLELKTRSPAHLRPRFVWQPCCDTRNHLPENTFALTLDT